MNRFHKTLAATVAALAISATPAVAASHNVSAQDQSWLQRTIQGDRFEIDGGQAAQQKGASQAVKGLGSRLAADHLKALKQAVSLAKRFGISRPGSPTESQKWEIATTGEFSGNAFDRHYASLEVADHKDDIDEAKSEIRDGRSPAIVALARKDLKLYRVHLKLAQDTLSAVGGA